RGRTSAGDANGRVRPRAGPHPRAGRVAGVERTAPELHADAGRFRSGREPPAASLVRVLSRGRAADARDVAPDRGASRGAPRAAPKVPRRAHPRRRRLRHLQLLGGGVPRARRRHRGGGGSAAAQAPRLRQRRRPLRRGDRPRNRRGAGKLSPGVHAHRPDQRGPLVARSPRGEEAPRRTRRCGGTEVNWPSALLGGFVGTLLLTTLEAGAQQLHLTRMSLPYLLGTAFTARRDRAKVIGFFAHLINGQLFALLY